ncbi:MAG: nitrate reductase molybdenum cofactor assembly chaperone [Acidimicrobiia bacterium]|nr:nitrate reductase molybdenum cofactor assembly chaperone [Acidimicrobiia bacterium]
MSLTLRRAKRNGRPTDADTAVVCMAASICLDYPGEDTDGALGLARDAILELPESVSRRHLLDFVSEWEQRPASTRRRTYVETFDLRRRCSLNLTYYTHGDTRGRGAALLGLRELFHSNGLEMQGRELPDHLPLVLEFVASAPTAVGVLVDHLPALELLRRALHDAGSPFGAVLDAVVSLVAWAPPVDERLLADLATHGPPTEQVGLQADPPWGCAGTERGLT